MWRTVLSMQMLRCLKSVDVWSTPRSARRRKSSHRQQRKMSKYTITAKGKEGKRAKTRMERCRRAKLTGKMQILLYSTKHTHTHMFSEYRLLCISCIYTYITHTQTHTFSVYVSLSFVYVCDRERVGFFSFSRSVCARAVLECILELLASVSNQRSF